MSARANLLSILHGRVIEARTPYGLLREAAAANANLAATQVSVCLTEAPLEHAWMMCEAIPGRAIQFSAYGLAFTKTWARRVGINPVWYIDQTPGHDWLTTPLTELGTLAASGHAAALSADGSLNPVSFEYSQIARIAPFVEHMGTYYVQKEFWWEREWRKVGNLAFSHLDVVVAFVPEEDHDAFANDLIKLEKTKNYATDTLPRLLDPRWGAERMIAALAGVPQSHVGPFPGA